MSEISSKGMVSFKMTGLDALDKALKKLESKVQRRVLNKAARAGARVVQKRAKALAPVRTGALRRAIRVVTMKAKKGQGKVAVTVKSGRGEKRDVFYAHMVEFGTIGARTRPFMRPAFDETQKEQLDAIGKTLAQEIIKAHDKV